MPGAILLDSNGNEIAYFKDCRDASYLIEKFNENEQTIRALESEIIQRGLA